MLSGATSLALTPVTRPRPYVLVVDDHEPSRRHLHAVLELAGHSCHSEGCATAAVRRCEVSRPQLVVTDLRMPNLDGLGLARWVRARYPSVPLILVTGEDLLADELVCLQRMFTDVFPKPVDIERLLDRVARLMPVTSEPRPSRP